MSHRKIFTVESHEQVLDVWRNDNTKNANVLHVDFHCDQRGLLINRKTQHAFQIWTRFPNVDEGNFLKHAVLEGIVGGIRWVYDVPGGRQHDIKSVKYATDLSAVIHRMALFLRRTRGIPIQYEAKQMKDWSGVREGEVLDIDWDFFACLEYPIESIQPRVDFFLSQDIGCIPEQTFVCYSPEYSHPTRSQYQDFVEKLAERFDAEVIDVPLTVRRRSRSRMRAALKVVCHPPRQLYHLACLALRKHGVY